MIEQVVEAIRAHRYHFSNEAELQDGIEKVLQFHKIDMEREVRLSAHDRIDFLCGRVGVEIKIAGSAAAVQRQLARYAAHGSIDGLILVTDRCQAGVQPKILNGKPLRIVALLSGLA